MAQLILLNKPYGVLCQFSDTSNRPTLAEHISTANVYPAGRLDLDSEGLLLLTDNGPLAHRITDPKHKQPKTYWVQVEGIPDHQALLKLTSGLELNDGPTRPCKANLMLEPDLWPRNPPMRERSNIPTQWIEITITEGRNRQVRRMTAAIGHPTLRLVRASIGSWALGKLLPGQSQTQTVHLPTEPPKRGKNPRQKPRRNTRKKSP